MPKKKNKKCFRCGKPGNKFDFSQVKTADKQSITFGEKLTREKATAINSMSEKQKKYYFDSQEKISLSGDVFLLCDACYIKHHEKMKVAEVLRYSRKMQAMKDQQETKGVKSG